MSKITIGAEQTEKDTVYHVIDNRAGSDMSHASKLFSVFQRFHSREDYEGTGIGLATVHRVITRQAGRICELTMKALKENRIMNPIISVGDGIEALENLFCESISTERKPVNPGMILLDKKIPRMDGPEFLSIIKKNIKYKRITVIMLTSSREEERLIKAYNQEVNAYFVKPIDFMSLVEVERQIGNFWAIVNELPSD